MTRRTKLLVTLIVMGLSGSCGRSGDSVAPPGMSEKEFISLMHELHVKPKSRTAILNKYGVSEAEVRAYVRVLARDPIALSQVLDTVQRRLDQDSVPLPKNFTPPPP